MASSDYISREAVLRDWPLCDEPGDAYQFIRNFPAADVRPVVRGVWVKNGWSIRCSICGYDMPFATRNFCPRCGACMEES